ncbi:hypothetical protein BU24DRAFT_134534 [Aaosphaeria arxii CBS 175.79]|uniref:Uncharacterized protein n=1 Tax=Aaosphaeria arxii CBS 175.79 TaxID=1450172 RepID=A0A6A5Y4G3_9PLEO|nr:uncharacterized protein BU24DRAFT_134534 [Aaosphaeria arxii CBS 175.79]KAF2020159.1 hypothetical protein BU24DRAFT_134534 [Aaosphaeria arxii CBS 175.79]
MRPDAVYFWLASTPTAKGPGGGGGTGIECASNCFVQVDARTRGVVTGAGLAVGVLGVLGGVVGMGWAWRVRGGREGMGGKVCVIFSFDVWVGCLGWLVG